MITIICSDTEGPYSHLRLQFYPARKRDECASLRSMTVEDTLFPVLVPGKLSDPCKAEGARLVASVARLAYERVRFVEHHYGRRIWAYPVGANDWDALARAEAKFGTDHCDAKRELARLDAHPCDPTVDEVADGVRRVLEWALFERRSFSSDLGGER